jgi:sterol desaturase/sphingolipid hydroxylase (fatty acid hydroxylase superfamily)
MHRIHHEYGRHRNNYGDFVWKEQRLGAMLAFRDVHA